MIYAHQPCACFCFMYVHLVVKQCKSAGLRPSAWMIVHGPVQLEWSQVFRHDILYMHISCTCFCIMYVHRVIFNMKLAKPRNEWNTLGWRVSSSSFCFWCRLRRILNANKFVPPKHSFGSVGDRDKAIDKDTAQTNNHGADLMHQRASSCVEVPWKETHYIAVLFVFFNCCVFHLLFRWTLKKWDCKKNWHCVGVPEGVSAVLQRNSWFVRVWHNSSPMDLRLNNRSVGRKETIVRWSIIFTCDGAASSSSCFISCKFFFLL